MFLRLGAWTNAHVQNNTYSNYAVQLCTNRPVSYKDGNCGSDECLITISKDNNAHVAACNDTKNYTKKVCLGTGAVFINMSCGNATVYTGTAPACNVPDTIPPNPPLNPPNLVCPTSTHCVYANETTGFNPACHVFGNITKNENGKNITCSLNNTWCPQYFVWNDVAKRCQPPFSQCDNNPPTNCDIPFCFANFTMCFNDFLPPIDPKPYNQSCCYFTEWFGTKFYNPTDIKVY